MRSCCFLCSILGERRNQAGSSSMTREVFATDVNNLFVTDSFLGYATAVKARIVLKTPHPVFGFVNGKAAYGIRRVRYYICKDLWRPRAFL